MDKELILAHIGISLAETNFHGIRVIYRCNIDLALAVGMSFETEVSDLNCPIPLTREFQNMTQGNRCCLKT